MKANMGTLDRVVRTVVALAIGALYFTGKISGTVAAVLGFFAVVFLITSLVSRCPLYVPLGLNTRKEPGA
jgi:hypothetical protein